MADGMQAAVTARTALFAALTKAQAKAHAVEKDAQNTYHRYAYVSAEAMIREAKEILTACDLAVIPTGSALDAPIAIAHDATSSDEWLKNARCAGVLRASWLVVHKDGGSVEVTSAWPVAPEKGRPIDKAVAAARTASLSYLLRDLLQIPRVEEGTDLDHDSRDDHRSGNGGVSIQEDLRQSIGFELDRLGLKGDARTAAVTKACGGQAPKTVDDLKKVLALLEKQR